MRNMSWMRPMRSAGFGRIGRRLRVDHRLRLPLPRLDLAEILLGGPHGVVVGIQLAAVRRADPPAQRIRLRLQAVENAAAVVEALRLALDLLGRTLQEQLPEQVRRAALGRHHRAARGVGLALRRGRPQADRREPRHVPEVVGRHLVHRDAVPEPVEPGPPRRGQPRDLGVVRLAAALLLVREPGEQRVPRPVLVDELEVLRGLVPGAHRLREPGRRIEPQRAADGHHPPGSPGRTGARDDRRHRFEQRQRHRHTRGAQERTTVERSGRDSCSSAPEEGRSARPRESWSV